MGAMIRPILLVCAVLCGSFLFTGCKDKEKEARRLQIREIMHGNTPDADMKAAIEKARATVGDFITALQKPASGQSKFLVRKSFPAEGGKQQILWVNNLTYDGKLLHGKLDDNTAQPGIGVAREGQVSFPPSEVADWMFNDNGKAAGGYMLRVFKQKFPEEWEKGRFSEQIPAFKD